MEEPRTEPGTEPPEADDDRRVAVETGGMASDPVSDTPPYASRRDAVTGGMDSDPIDEPDDTGSS